uniref:F-box domain-containing protein n=1 Tax=Meloidogyne enterolobii TaxID=390850 RepID=A0A6V7XQC4_MELEN|nr:unnamed protein product [Meloidogyne enterolobii]
MLNLPVEVKLDILKFLSFNQLLSFQQTNYYFYCLIRQNEGILACEGLFSVQIKIIDLEDFTDNCKYKMCKIESGIFNFLLNDQLIEKWQSAVDKRIPVYFSLSDTPPTNKLYTMVDTGFPLYNNNYYMLKLPVYPKNIEEMKIVRCWLEKLFLCYFEFADFREYFFNPEMIKILFDNEKNIPTQLRSEKGYITYCNHNIKNVLGFTLDHLIITRNLEINFKQLDSKGKCNKYLLELLINGGNNIRTINIKRDINSLLLLIEEHIKTKDCLSFVSSVCLEIIGFTRRKEKESCIITNTYNTKVSFELNFDGKFISIIKKLDKELK